MNYFKKLQRVRNTINEKELNIEIGGIWAGKTYNQNFISTSDGHFYTIILTREELRLPDSVLKEKIIHKIKNEKEKI